MLKPVGPFIVVSRDDSAGKTPGGIVIPDQYKEKSGSGVIESVGSGFYTELGVHIPLTLKPGDRIVFGKHAGFKVEHEGKEYWMMREGDVLAVAE